MERYAEANLNKYFNLDFFCCVFFITYQPATTKLKELKANLENPMNNSGALFTKIALRAKQ